MLDKIKVAFKKTNLIITVPIILIIILAIGNGYVIYQNNQVTQKITTQNKAITKVSNDFAKKYKTISKKAKQEFKATHTNPLNQ
ncbi:hypothetical protein [Fructilactobacillus sanfranciscensis]|uniref:Uncharacterized protein n=2 Tax=Fructilactobacillus sanfranciscensis TaxID=1625 RepID=G2KUK0_FRUST|nr:hypothetical protein [Fructilactobacillus sanfranciscensis]AEN99598.1 hypothetical protein LSA_12240 [Fructilactobacillus sanfranciscensis TMW 1.1304]NDR60537.1 hypothetical protein [Fructilactobacillus sanfranciscensis]NDR70068.1 hypothetical protein [Fructilactobacillus sanfranciscensis]NDR76208.1 hypothetical protein [Fructilactobacillus sanfranciscensis]NDR96901.1 hypothetical protein [Fructilactobacillus sanfranciscensis]